MASRQAEWAKRKREQGKCGTCGKDAVNKLYCEIHRQKWNERQNHRRQAARSSKASRVVFMGTVKAPFTTQQVETINRYQSNEFVHPLTCGSGNRTDERHTDGEGVLVAYKAGLSCPFCGYSQNWISDIVLESADYNPLDEFAITE